MTQWTKEQLLVKNKYMEVCLRESPYVILRIAIIKVKEVINNGNEESRNN